VSINFVDQANAANHYTTPPPSGVLDIGVYMSIGDFFYSSRSIKETVIICTHSYSLSAIDNDVS